MNEFWTNDIPQGARSISGAAHYLGLSTGTLGVYAATGGAPDCYRDALSPVGQRWFLHRDLDAWLIANPHRGAPPGGRPDPTVRLPPRPVVQLEPPRKILPRNRLMTRPVAMSEARKANGHAARALAVLQSRVAKLRRQLQVAERDLDEVRTLAAAAQQPDRSRRAER